MPTGLWSSQEQLRFEELARAGRSCAQISKALKRTRSSVRHRMTGQGFRAPKFRKSEVTLEYPRVRVPKQLVIDYYELGWRVLDIGATTCTLEWRLSRAPEYPVARVVEAAPTPNRVLEIA